MTLVDDSADNTPWIWACVCASTVAESGVVNVFAANDPIQPLPDSATVYAQTQAQIQGVLSALSSTNVIFGLNSTTLPPGIPYNGALSYEVKVGFQLPPTHPLFDPQAGFYRFIPQSFTIESYDTINFTAASFSPHDIGLNSSGIFNNAAVVAPGEPPGTPPTVSGSQNWLFVFGDPTNYTGGVLSLGFFKIGAPTFLTPQYSPVVPVTFTAPGKFPLDCVLHDFFGMVGEATVTLNPNPPPQPQPQPVPQLQPETIPQPETQPVAGSASLGAVLLSSLLVLFVVLH